MIQIIPALLATSELEFIQKLSKIERSESFKDGWIQIDLMDNKFVPNQSVTPEIIKNNKPRLKIEAQLMAQFPENWIDDLVKIPVDRIVFPVEDLSGLSERILHIKNHGIEVGLSLNPETEIEKITPFAGKIDLVLVMSVNPGFGGQVFIKDSIEKISKIKNTGWPVRIEIDGGIGKEQVRMLVDAGADNLVIGSHLLEGDIDENLEAIWEAIKL